MLRRFAPRALIADRQARVLWLGLFSIALAFAGAVLFADAMLLWAPLVLGVPHLLADVRYLVVRPRLHTSAGFWLLIAAPALLTSLGAPVGVGLLAVVGAGLLQRRPLIVAAGVALAALGWGERELLLHAHNFIALGIWWSWRPRPLSMLAIPAAAVLGWVALGPFSLPSFAFMQAVHYALWLRLIPEDDRDRPAPRSFRASWASLRADFGRWPLAVFGGLALGLGLWACFAAGDARDAYFAVAAFHGFLELGVVARR